MTEKPDTESRDPSRRRFLKGAGTAIAVAGVTLGTVQAATTSKRKTNNIDRWVGVEQVATPADVDVGYTEHHVKEPTAYLNNGNYYIICSVRDGYGGSHSNRDVVLLESASPDGPFTQLSQVTDNGDSYAPGFVIDGTDVWVYVSDGSGTGDVIRAYRQPVGSIGPDPADWTDEGTVVSDGKDASIARSSDGTYHMYCVDKTSGAISRYDSTDLLNWSLGDGTIYDGADAQVAPNLAPHSESGYWLVLSTRAKGGTNARYAIAAYGSAKDAASFSGQYEMCTEGSLNGIKEAFYSDWTTHFTYTRTNKGEDAVYLDGDILTYFEGGDGTEYSLGAAIADTGGDYY